MTTSTRNSDSKIHLDGTETRHAAAPQATATAPSSGRRTADPVGDIKQEGSRFIEEGKHAIAELAAQKRSEAAGRVQGFSSALGRAAGELAGENEVVAGYMSDAARQLSGVSERIRTAEPAEILHQLEQATRRHPGVVIGFAAAAAFLVARFAQSSDRHVSQSIQRRDRY